jgi:hypothetical protein
MEEEEKIGALLSHQVVASELPSFAVEDMETDSVDEGIAAAEQ